MIIDVVIAPTFLHLVNVYHSIDSYYKVAAQNSSAFGYGAYTGEISSKALADAKISWVILGHSERRQIYKETDHVIASKTKAAIANGLSVIACFGETLDERKAEKTLEVVKKQLDAFGDSLRNCKQIVLAYEPVWAIGTGLNATPEQAQEVHFFVRGYLKEKFGQDVASSSRIIYGGSVKGSNAKDLLVKPDIDGFLVGGASLTKDFIDIIKAAQVKKSKL